MPVPNLPPSLVKLRQKWVTIYIPKELADELQPLADSQEPRMTLSDIVTILTIQGSASLSQKVEEHNKQIVQQKIEEYGPQRIDEPALTREEIMEGGIVTGVA
jgi:hypothetical protein